MYKVGHAFLPAPPGGAVGAPLQSRLGLLRLHRSFRTDSSGVPKCSEPKYALAPEESLILCVFQRFDPGLGGSSRTLMGLSLLRNGLQHFVCRCPGMDDAG